MNSEHEEAIGKVLRHRDSDMQRLSFVNAELSQSARNLKTAASQLELLLDQKPSEVHSVLSRVNINHVLKLLAEREQLCNRIGEANAHLKRLRSGPS